MDSLVDSNTANPKDKVDNVEKSGIYEFKCNNCGSIYVDQSGVEFY